MQDRDRPPAANAGAAVALGANEVAHLVVGEDGAGKGSERAAIGVVGGKPGDQVDEQVLADIVEIGAGPVALAAPAGLAHGIYSVEPITLLARPRVPSSTCPACG